LHCCLQEHSAARRVFEAPAETTKQIVQLLLQVIDLLFLLVALGDESTTLNTSFVERLDLTIRQGSTYLTRRSTAHALQRDQLADHVELLRCHYNFVRPHRALKFGTEMRTPATLATRLLPFRDIFCSRVFPASATMHRAVFRSCVPAFRTAA